MSKSQIICAYCGRGALKENGAIARALRGGFDLYCNRECSAKGRSFFVPPSQRKAEKADYDCEYRRLNRAALKAKKAAHYQRTRDPEREREIRKQKMPRHVEYCRRPEYRKWKASYDRKYRAAKDFGPFGEAAILLYDLQAEILSRASRYEIDLASGTLNKKLQRRRDYERQTDRR